MTGLDSKIGASIEQFLGFFSDKLNIISESEFNGSSCLFKKILYVGILDALSKTTTSPNKWRQNRERIVSFIKHFTDWKHQEHVSLPHLVRFLNKVPDPEFSRLRHYAFNLYDSWTHGNIIGLENDPKLSDLKKLWPNATYKPFEDLTLEHLQHSNMFYKYRNSLVHELREPSYGMEFKNDVEPFYHSMTQIDNYEKTWELVYPLGFYEQLCKAAIRKLRYYYTDERIDPYTLYKFGSYWIEELN